MALEPIRFQAAAVLYSMVGVGMSLWGTTPSRVDTLFDVNLLRSTQQVIPGAPVDTLWTPVVSVKIQQKARVKDEERKWIVVDSGGGTRRLVEVKV